MSKKYNKVIVGSGFLAKKFRKYYTFLKKNNITIYAAGVSNSLEKNPREFQKELQRFNIFCKKNKNKLVYISTYSIFDNSRNKSRYIKNKIKIETMIKKNISNYLIVRFPEIVGLSNNPNTLTNFFYQKIKEKKSFVVFKNSKRNLIDVDDALKICIYFISLNKNINKTINILNKKYFNPVKIVKLLESILNTKGKHKILNKGKKNWRATNSINSKIEKKLNLRFKNNYLNKVLKKYYK